MEHISPADVPLLPTYLANTRVLVVDDEEAVLELISKALALKGVQAVCTRSAEGALLNWRVGAFECVISDIRMPGRTGLDLLSEIRSRDRQVGFVLMTGAGEASLARRAMRAGCDDFLMKPLELDDLFVSLQLALEKRSMRTRLHQDRDRFARLASERLSRLQHTLESLDNALMAEKIAHRQTVLVLAQAAESSERDLGRHIHRVAAYSAILGRQLGYNDIDADFLGLSATLHDVGKLAVPAEYLTREGPLSPTEFDEVKKHTIAGGRILKGVDCLKQAREIALGHHERWDGDGYPYGLAGEYIPLSARIVALTDVWDALVSRRSYKQAWPMDRCLDYVNRERGKHFDPAVVDAFMACQDEFESVRCALGDDAPEGAGTMYDLLRPSPPPPKETRADRKSEIGGRAPMWRSGTALN